LLRQSVVNVIIIGRGDAVNNTLGSIAHGIVLIADTVVAIESVCDGLACQAVEIVIRILCTTAAEFVDLYASARGMQSVIIGLDCGAQAIEGFQFRQGDLVQGKRAGQRDAGLNAKLGQLVLGKNCLI
jgi:hypothetical protein